MDTVNGTGTFGSLFTTCTQDLNTMFNGKAALVTTIKGIGALMAVAIAMGHLFENLERGQDQVESVFKVLIELMFTFIILINAEKIMGAIATMGTALVKRFAVTSSATASYNIDELKKTLSGKTDGGFQWFIQCFMSLVIPWMLSILIGIAAKFVVIQIMLEIAIRRAFAPLAVVDVYKEGLRSPGVRYFKKYFAAFVKLMICGFICMLLPNIIAAAGNLGSDSDGAFNYMFCVVAINFAAIGIMLKAGEYANDVVGV
jgi:hypothetical protein